MTELQRYKKAKAISIEYWKQRLLNPSKEPTLDCGFCEYYSIPSLGLCRNCPAYNYDPLLCFSCSEQIFIARDYPDNLVPFAMAILTLLHSDELMEYL